MRLGFGLAAWIAWSAAVSVSFAGPPRVVFVAGDDEYRSEESLPMLAGILKKHHGCEVTCLFTTNGRGEIDPGAKDRLPGLEALDNADLMVLYMRWRALKDADLERIAKFAKSGRAMAGFRTTTHTFKYDDAEHKKFNDDWPIDVFGQKWITHHGHFGDGNEFLTDVKLAPEQADNPILRGVKPFKAYSWLYHVDGGDHKLGGDAVPLVFGTALKSGHMKNQKKFPLVNPVAWTKTHAGANGQKARVFFTTLGHPFDFRDENMRRLAVNGLLWALGKERDIPASGANVDLAKPYDPPNSGVGNFRKARLPADAAP